MIDQSIRATSIGASEVASILGMDPRRTPFHTWALKTGKISPDPPTPRMWAGKKMERFIAEQLYAEAAERPVRWMDITYQHPVRQFQCCTPDAMSWKGDFQTLKNIEPPDAMRLVECKNVSWDQAADWGDAGSDQVPQRILLQCHWQMSCMGLVSQVDIAAFFGGNTFKIFPVMYDKDIETTLLTECEKWHRRYIIEGVEPEITFGEGARRYLRERFPRNIADMRAATEKDRVLVDQYTLACLDFASAEQGKEIAGNKLRLAIGDHDGIEGLVTYRKDKDSMGTDWESIARNVWKNWCEERNVTLDPIHWNGEWTELISAHQIVTREGPRKLRLIETRKRKTA
jgi:putative phage-type endonuclease